MRYPVLTRKASEVSPTGTTGQQSPEDRFLALADACFEMFSMRELGKPWSIFHEITAEFPDLSRQQIFGAVRLALSWRRLLSAAGEPVH